MSEPERRSKVAWLRRPSGHGESAGRLIVLGGIDAHFWGRRRGGDLLDFLRSQSPELLLEKESSGAMNGIGRAYWFTRSMATPSMPLN